MKNIKDIVIGIFAIIGFTAIVTGFTNVKDERISQSSSILASPETHVWEVVPVGNQAGFLLNKKTGEVKALKWKTAWSGLKISAAEDK